MPPKRDPVPRARSPLQWLAGILLLGVLGAGVIAAGITLWQNIDVQRLARTPPARATPRLPEPLPATPGVFVERPFRVAILHSASTEQFFPDPLYYGRQLGRWERLVERLGGRARRLVSAEEIDSLDTDEVLVAPAPVCLDDWEVDAIRGHAERGGGVVLTWAVAARDSSCNWVGYERMADLVGALEAREVEKREALYITVPAGIPLSLGFDPAARVELSYESQVALQAGGARLYWSDWALNAYPAAKTPGIDAAALMRWTEAGGRIVWYGFRLGHGASREDEESVERLFQNGVRWAANIPAVSIEPWPNGMRSALLITQDVESKFDNVLELANLARRKAAPVTFFVVSQLTEQHPELADSLASVGEVGSHTSDHTVLAGRRYADQRSRLQRSRSEIRNWTGEAVRGLRPPEERFDENTLRAWVEAGGTYLIGVNDARSASPEVYQTRAGTIVLLPRVIKDDYNVFVQEGALRTRHLTRAYLDGMAKVRSLGGLAVINIHSQVGGEAARVGVIGEVIDSTRVESEWWLATGSEVAEWWLARREAAVSLADSGAHRLHLNVSAPVSRALAGAWLHVIVPGEPSDWTPYYDGESLPHAVTNWGLKVPVPSMAAGEKRTIILENGAIALTERRQRQTTGG